MLSTESLGGRNFCISRTLAASNLFLTKKPLQLAESVMATRRFLMIDRVVYVKARINGLVGVFLRMDLVALERVMVEVRRRGWICICKLTKRMLAKFVLERKFPQSASTWWVKNFSTLLVVSCECLWKW